MKFKKAFFWFFLPVLSLNVSGQNTCIDNNRSVFFGERSQELTAPAANVVRVFLDKQGTYYPDFYIDDRQIEDNCSNIIEWYRANPTSFDRICTRYGLSNSETAETRIEQLNNRIVADYISEINSKAANCDFIDVLIHGFRKKVYGKIDNSASYSDDDNEILRRRLGQDTTKRILYVEIYWDSKFITPIQSYKYKGFRLFENSAIPNADNVGLALRQTISGISHKKINIITHSLGARVASELLFNANGSLRGENSHRTPGQDQIRLIMIAPAIGHELFNNFYLRNTGYDFNAADNYSISLVFNTNDFVLQKQYGHGVNALATENGNTSLGCNYQQDILQLTNLFARSFVSSPTPIFFDFSLNNERVGMYCHLVSCYANHNNFANIASFLHR